MNKYEKFLMLLVGITILLSGCAAVEPVAQTSVKILPGQVELLQPGTTLDMLMRAVTTDNTDLLRMAKDNLILLGGRVEGLGWGFACFDGDSPCSYQTWKLVTGGKANLVNLQDLKDLTYYLKVWCGWETLYSKYQIPAGLVKSIKDGFAAKMGSAPIFIFMIPQFFEIPNQILPTPAGIQE